MNKTRFIATSALLASAFGIIENDPRFVAHEIAHALLLLGRVRPGMYDTTVSRVEQMPPARANSHEVRTCALELHGLRALGQARPVHELARESWSGLVETSRSQKYRTVRAFKVAILATQVRPSMIRRFVRVYTDFARYAR